MFPEVLLGCRREVFEGGIVMAEDLTPGEKKVLQAARAYANALAVFRGSPPWTADDVMNIFTAREMVLVAAGSLVSDREAGPTAPGVLTSALPVLKPENG
jgi:hypothetical protein